MAILNLTPDSFSDGGVHPSDPASLLPTLQMYLSAGMTILDIGGQSTRPRAPQVSPQEELSRVLPAIKFIRTQPAFDKVAISIDTYRAYVAKAAVEAGANVVNDVSGGQMDPDMLYTIAGLGCTIILMHMRGTPETMMNMISYPEGVLAGVGEELADRVQAAEKAGIRRWRIVLDPGIGFAKDSGQNLELLRRLRKLRGFKELQGLPWLVGTSRKGFIGKITGEEDPADRVWGTAGAVTAAIQGGADIVRVHDVEEMSKVVKMADAIWRIEYSIPKKRPEADTEIAGKDQKAERNKLSEQQKERSVVTINGQSGWARWSPHDPESISNGTTALNAERSGLTAQMPMSDLNAAEIDALTSSTTTEPLPQVHPIRSNDKAWERWTPKREDAITEDLTSNTIDSQGVVSQHASPKVEMPISDLDATEIAALPGSNPPEPVLQPQSMSQRPKTEGKAWKRWTPEEEDANSEDLMSPSAESVSGATEEVGPKAEMPITDLNAAEISSLSGFRTSDSSTEASADPSDPASKPNA